MYGEKYFYYYYLSNYFHSPQAVAILLNLLYKYKNFKIQHILIKLVYSIYLIQIFI